MFCLCSKFHRQGGRYISGEIKPIFPCHNCTSSCTHHIKLFIKKSSHLAYFSFICSNKGRHGRSVCTLILCLALLHWDVVSVSNFVTRHKRETRAAELRGKVCSWGITTSVASFLFLWQSLYSQATMPAFRRSKTRAKSLALARKTQQQAAAAYGSLHRMLSVVSSAAAWLQLGVLLNQAEVMGLQEHPSCLYLINNDCPSISNQIMDSGNV